MAAGDSLEAWISSSRAAAEEHERKARFLRESIGWKQAGLLAERAVGRELDALGRVGWRVLHDRAVPGSLANIDHLLVGPPGIVVIDAKAHKGTLTMDAGGPRVGGRAFSDNLDKLVRYSRTVEASSGRRTSVYSVICFTEHVGLEQPRQVGAVTLLELRQLLAWLGQLPGVLAPRQVWYLAELLEESHPDRLAPAAPARPASPAPPAPVPPRPMGRTRTTTSATQSRRPQPSHPPRRTSSRRRKARTSAAQSLVALLALLAALGVVQHAAGAKSGFGQQQPTRTVSTR